MAAPETVHAARATATTARWVALGAGAGFVLLALLVRLGVTDGLDVTIRDLARPHDEWGSLQIRADHLVEGLRPTVVGTLLAVLAVVVSLLRRSVRPALLAAATGLLAAGLTIGTKLALNRPDPHGETSHGGSFPSGHTVGVVVCLGVAVWLVRPGARWWAWLAPGLAGVAMAVALVLEGAHWCTDVVGGGLLATATLAAVRVAALDTTLSAALLRRAQPAQ